tara:strand:+ start:181 stop:345 length:165 start_codon:yes stop_codon:yes gene_type:complete
MKLIKKQIQMLEEEAEAHLTLHASGRDAYALDRYEMIMQQLNKLREQYGNSNTE